MKTLFSFLSLLLISQVMMAQATWFGPNYTHRDSSINCNSDYTDLDSTQIGANNAGDKLIFNHVYGTTDGTHREYMIHNCGLWFDSPVWSIFDETEVAMDTLLAFNVLNPKTNGTVFTHTVDSANSTLNWSDIDNALLNGHPEAVFFITKTWDNGVYDTAHVGIWYDHYSSKWSVYDEDGVTPLQLNSTYNIFVPNASTSFFKDTASGSNYITYLDNPLLNGNPNAGIFIVHDYTDSIATQGYINDEIGVWYDGSASKWTIYTENITSLFTGSTFNVLVVANTNPAGITENKNAENKLIVSPNPANDKVTVLLDQTNSSVINSIMITGIDGRTVLKKSIKENTSKQILLDVSDLNSGLYLLNVKTNQGMLSSKLCIMR
jgi:hypothetical protein